MDLQGKVAFVSGGGRGIGRETCRLLAGRGAKVAAFSRSGEETRETASLIRAELGGEAIGVFGDVRSEADIGHAVRETGDRLGPIDILVNNAGVMLLKPFVETEPQEWDFMQEVNVRGVYLLSRAVVPGMIKRQGGVVVNVSSIWGTKGGPNRSAYVASKHAVIGFTKALGEELKPHGVRVVAVCPGPVDTRMTRDMAPDANRDNWMQPVDIAHIITDLCSPKSAAVTATAVEAFGYGRPVST